MQHLRKFNTLEKGLNSDFSVSLKWFCENALITSSSVKKLTELLKLTFVCSEGLGTIRHICLGAFLKWIPGLSKKPGI